MAKQRVLGLAFLILAPYLMVGCSSQGAKKDAEELEASLSQGDTELPAADEVGSIPEDNQDALDELAKSSPNAGADPFADLEDNLNANKDTEPTEGQPQGGSGEMKNYKVRRGDTLMKIAFKLYGDIDRWKDLKAWNSTLVGRASQLEKGTVLRYQDEGEFVVEKHDYSYKIQNGDTIGGIAKNIYGKQNKWRKLQKYNARLVKNPNRIFAGFLLYYNITPQEQQEAEQMRNQLGAAPTEAPAPAASASMPAATETTAPSAPAPTIPSAEPLQGNAPPVAAAPGSAPVAQ